MESLSKNDVNDSENVTKWKTAVSHAWHVHFSLCTFRSRSRPIVRDLKQARQRRQQERYKFAYLTMKNSSFALFARAVFIFGHLADVLVFSTTWNDLFCSCVDDVSIWCLSLKRRFQFNFKKVRTHFSSSMALNNWEIIVETRGYIFRWRYCCRRRRCLMYDDVDDSLSWFQGCHLRARG